jgi:hypothetical protein
MERTIIMTVYMGTSKPRFVIYLQRGFVPKFYHKELSGAIQEAMRLAKEHNKRATIVEYFEDATIVGRVHPDGTMEEVK